MLKEIPYLVVSDECGNIFEIPEYRMTGMSLNIPLVPAGDEIIPLPTGSDLFRLPGRGAIGFDPVKVEYVRVQEYHGKKVYPVAGFMAPAYLQLYRCSFYTLQGAERLPLYSYTAVGWYRGRFYAAGIRIDPDQRQDLKWFDLPEIHNSAKVVAARFRKNRLVQHLVENCVFSYGCPAARNFVMGRWECPLPTSPGCNAGCVGCISKQPSSSGIKPSQDRISFIPEVDEIVEVAVSHLEHAERAVVSFGQGCEGEPLLVGELIEDSIREIRKRTERGVININTNGSKPGVIERLCRAGLDSIRVSVNSAQEDYYNRYFLPVDYIFEDVIESLKIARSFNIWTSINYFIFPGLTDHPIEMEALKSFINKVKLNMVQTRNINIDPEFYIQELHLSELGPCFKGMRNWLEFMKRNFPWLKIGYFNPPREEMRKRNFEFCKS
ncbi:MAG: radical SAM protein [Spirochaetota bacterium]